MVILYFSNEQDKVEVPETCEDSLKEYCTAVLLQQNFTHECEISVTLVDNEQIKALNLEYRNKDLETDVLSFPLGENDNYDINPDNGCYILGDIVISMEKVVSQAVEYGHSFTREFAYLVVHSMLHLLGYDHVNSSCEEAEMNKQQDAIMNILAITR